MPSIPADTDPAVFELQVERWRSMSLVERVALIDQLNIDVELLAIAGIRSMHPEFDEVQIRRELVRRRYGDRLADEAYAHLPS